MDAVELILLYDYYGDLLTDRQRECFEMRYNQDLSLGEIAAELGISRQGVHDNLSRTEALLRNMEAKTGCVSRDRNCRLAAREIAACAQQLQGHPEGSVARIAEKILSLTRGLEE